MLRPVAYSATGGGIGLKWAGRSRLTACQRWRQLRAFCRSSKATLKGSLKPMGSKEQESALEGAYLEAVLGEEQAVRNNFV